VNTHHPPLWAALCGAAALLVSGAARADSLEYPIKAAFLYKFGSYVEWPSGAFAAPSAPLILCVTGRDPFGAVLDQTVSGRTVGTHPVVIRRMPTASRGAGCHIAFLGGSAEQPVAESARAFAGAPVLTVTEGAETPGAIRLMVKDNRVRFEIDQRAAQLAGVAISSKLLNLAVAVLQ
jgi:hypothetical protein